MNESTTKLTKHFTGCASLAAIGVKLRQLDLFGPIRKSVRIAQKTVKHTPIDKLYDAFISLLAGAHGLVEINTRLRADPALQEAFGRSTCAEQSVVQETLDACTAENVKQMEQALDQIYRQHSQGYRHDYARQYQLLDVDMSGMPCGPKAAFATKGYEASQRNRRGRQLGRVFATRYQEIVVDRLFDGKTSLPTALQPLIEAAEVTLHLDEPKRARTLVRTDGGGGSLDDVNWLLSRGYQILCKDYSSKRVGRLLKSVHTWIDDPRVAGRQVGWVTEVASEYVRPVQRIAVRCRKPNGQWGTGVLISTLTPAEVLILTEQTMDHLSLLQTALISVTTKMEGRSMRVGISHGPGWFPVAVQALVVLAETDGPCSSSAMAQDLKAHAVYLRRVLAQLVRANLIQAREGRDGGYRLARSADHITLAEVYQAVVVTNPAEHTAGSGGVNARVQIILDEIGAEAEHYLLDLLSHHTLASVLERVAISGRPS